MSGLLTILKALSDETRLRLLHLLLTRNLCGKALARSLGISEAAVSQHLKILREAGLVEGERQGYWTHYSLKKETLEETISGLQRIASKSTMLSGQCRLAHAREKGYTGKETKKMCKSCCEKPVLLKERPEKCTPEQIKECHGDVKEHPCTQEKKES